ncbi:hypothetical protein ACQUGU_19675 [Acinetobacter baumannii]|uniref:hypothetical protein n=1 Tax=Acinetobacter baumannii TaxID=470 RepID=UPI003FA3507D
MHDEAELGVCSHFNYKEGSKNTDHSFNHRLHSLRAVLEHYQNVMKQQYIKMKMRRKVLISFKTLKVLKRFMSLVVMVILKNYSGSTVLDFAYHVHTEVGNSVMQHVLTSAMYH